jgi:predicted RND superfamily exporter protein
VLLSALEILVTDSQTSSTDFIETVSRGFEWLAGWIFDHRLTTMGGCLALVLASAVYVAGIRVDNSFEAYFDTGDPPYVAYSEFRRDFGSDEISYLLYEAPSFPEGPWNLEVMRKIADLGDAIEREVPFVKEVTSIANVEVMDPVPDGIRIYSLTDDFPKTQAALLEFKRKILGRRMYVGGLASADGKYGALIVEMAKSSVEPIENLRVDPALGNQIDNIYPQATYEAIEFLLARPEYAGITFHHTGDVPLNAVINKITAKESRDLGILCFVVVAVVLALFMRRPSGIVAPMLVVGLATLITIGFVGFLGWNLDQMFGMMPALIISVGVADTVHIISEFRVYKARLGDRREALRRTLYLVGTPCLLTSLTTAAGFAAMGIAPIKAISRFGIYSAFGVVIAFVLTVTLVVALLSFGRRYGTVAPVDAGLVQTKGSDRLQRFFDVIVRFDLRHRRAILVVVGLLFCVALAGMRRLEVESNFLAEFGDTVPIRSTTTLVDSVMGGSLTFSYLFDAGREDAIKDPAVLREIERLQEEAERQTDMVRKTYSIVDFLKEINKAFHDDDPAFYVIPDTRELVAQYLLLYEMSGGEEANDYVSNDYSRARLEIRSPLVDSSRMSSLVERLKGYLAREPVEKAGATLTGMGALWLKLMTYLTESQIKGFLAAFVAIATMMCILFRSVKLGLLSMVPNLVPVFFTLGGMGWSGVPLDYVRLLIAPVAIGMAVDYAIHHVTRCRYEFSRSGSYEQALRESFTDVGRALIITSVVLVAGFCVFTFSVMNSMIAFGLLLSTTIVMALVADFVLMPVLLMTFKPFGPERPR